MGKSAKSPRRDNAAKAREAFAKKRAGNQLSAEPFVPFEAEMNSQEQSS
jgi:hypothetical protein